MKILFRKLAFPFLLLLILFAAETRFVCGQGTLIINPFRYGGNITGFSDPFNDTVIDPDLWDLNVFLFDPTVVNTGVTLEETEGNLRMTLLPSVSGNNYNGIATKNTWDFTNKRVHLRYIGQTNGISVITSGFYVYIDNNNWFRWTRTGSSFNRRKKIAGVDNFTQQSGFFDFCDYFWWAIRHNAAANEIYFETSVGCNNISSPTWIVRETVPFTGNVSAVKFGFYAGTTGSTTASLGNRTVNADYVTLQ